MVPQKFGGELVGSGDGLPFARDGRTLREWVQFPVYDADGWAQLIDESINCDFGDATRSGQVSRPHHLSTPQSSSLRARFAVRRTVVRITLVNRWRSRR
ncbi:MAG: hypothetical protein WBN93_13085, partial [Acidimicrobiia bacterium]